MKNVHSAYKDAISNMDGNQIKQSGQVDLGLRNSNFKIAPGNGQNTYVSEAKEKF